VRGRAGAEGWNEATRGSFFSSRERRRFAPAVRPLLHLTDLLFAHRSFDGRKEEVALNEVALKEVVAMETSLKEAALKEVAALKELVANESVLKETTLKEAAALKKLFAKETVLKQAAIREAAALKLAVTIKQRKEREAAARKEGTAKKEANALKQAAAIKQATTNEPLLKPSKPQTTTNKLRSFESKRNRNTSMPEPRKILGLTPPPSKRLATLPPIMIDDFLFPGGWGGDEELEEDSEPQLMVVERS